MKTLKEAVEHVLDLKGSIVALEEAITALLLATPPAQRAHAQAVLLRRFEGRRAILLGSVVSEHVLAAFERDAQALLSTVRGHPGPGGTTQEG